MAKNQIAKVENQLAEYPVAQMGSVAEVQELINDALGGGQLGFQDIPSVGMPSGGSQFFEVPTLGGQVEPVRTITGVIIFRHMRRAYWSDPEPQDGASPDCASPDGETGYGDPGGDCSVCPLAQFGSSPKGNNAQACTQRNPLYLVTPDALLPLRVNVGPTSIQAVRSYAIGLLNQARKPMHAVVTQLGLEKTTNKGGQDYSRLTMQMAGELSEADLKLVNGYREAFVPQIQGMLRAQAGAMLVNSTDIDEGDEELAEV